MVMTLEALETVRSEDMSVVAAIGNTPLVELTNLNGHRPTVRVFGKLEGNNPGGSVKDRPVHFMIEAAEHSGQLGNGKTILEPTSGNTGIALAMIGSARGYRVKLCMPACVSVERRSVLEAFGAEVVLTPAGEGTDGAIRLAHRLAEEDPDTYYMPNQFQNDANIRAHYETTGPEILAQTDGQVGVVVAGMGTTGTLISWACPAARLWPGPCGSPANSTPASWSQSSPTGATATSAPSCSVRFVRSVRRRANCLSLFHPGGNN